MDRLARPQAAQSPTVATVSLLLYICLSLFSMMASVEYRYSPEEARFRAHPAPNVHLAVAYPVRSADGNGVVGSPVALGTEEPAFQANFVNPLEPASAHEADASVFNARGPPAA
ncbi:MAG: hypothetical protein JWN93_902 [Hyphomicrobiales bacterium]|nr:hypothetical protein [Hyphomicrobiales bacterium]